MKEKLARAISTLGHPLLTAPLFIIVVLFKNNEFKSALFLTSLIIGCIFVPLIVWMFLKTKNGSYTNFDVSDRQQRRSLFVFAIPFLAIVTLLLYLTHQPRTICLCLLFSTILVIVSQIINLKIKSSLHVSLTIFLAFMALVINPYLGGFFMVLSIFIGWSRVVLKRHTLAEVIVGAIVGLTIGTVLVYFLTLKV